MWIVSGWLDGVKQESQDAIKSKLLTPGETYTVTRKYQDERSLVVNSKKVGAEHAGVGVGEHSVEDCENPDVIPSLQFRNARPKELMYTRDGVEGNNIIASKGTVDLKSGDVVSVIAGWELRFEWKPIVVYVPPDVDLEEEGISLRDCASLGIKILHTIGQGTFSLMTHQLAKSLSATPLQVVSLVHNTHIVTPAWLKELLRLSKTPHLPPGERRDSEEQNLFDRFALAKEGDYIPPPADPNSTNTNLPHPWPTQSRLNLFHPLSFTLVSSKVQSTLGTKAIYDALEMTGGRPTTFDVGREVDAGGKGKGTGTWVGHLGVAERKAGERLKAEGGGKRGYGGKGLILVADEEDMMRIVGRDVWEGVFVGGAKSVQLNFVSPSTILEAIILNDASAVLAQAQAQAQASSADTSDNLNQNGTDTVKEMDGSRSTLGEEEEQEQPAPAPRKLPPRRAGSATPSRSGSAVPEGAASANAAAAAAGGGQSDAEPATQTRRPLKRRARTGVSHLNAFLGLDDDDEEPKPKPSVSGAEGSSSKPEMFNGVGTDDDIVVKAEPISQRPIPRSRLKRRAGQASQANGADTGTSTLAAIEEEIREMQAERPSKRLKAMFEAADPARLSPIRELRTSRTERMKQGGGGGGGEGGSRAGSVEAVDSSEKQVASKKRSRPVEDGDGEGGNMDLDTIHEEEIEAALEPSSQATSIVAARRRGRSVSVLPPPPAGQSTTSRKRRAIEGVRAVESSSRQTSEQPPSPPLSTSHVPAPRTPSKANTNAKQSSAPTTPIRPLRIVRSISPDRDLPFLQALADLKMRRSKNDERETDKDFMAIRDADESAQPRVPGTAVAVDGGETGKAKGKGKGGKKGGKEAGAEVGDENEKEKEKGVARDWVLLDDMKLDYGIRGNFMRIVEFEVVETEVAMRRRGSKAEEGLTGEVDEEEGGDVGEPNGSISGSGSGKWEGRPNFKAFRRNGTLFTFSSSQALPPAKNKRFGKENQVVARSGKVDLVMHKEPDYGNGSAYWNKNSQSMQWRSQPAEHPGAEVFTYQLNGGSQRTPTDSQSKMQTQTGVEKQAKGKGKEKDASTMADGSQPLFFESDREPEPEREQPPAEPASTLFSDEDMDFTLKSTTSTQKKRALPPRRAAKGKGKQKLLFSDEGDSDASMNDADNTLAAEREMVNDLAADVDPSPPKNKKGSKGGTKAGGKKGKQAEVMMLDDDDSDDGMVFGRRRKTTRGRR